MLEISFGKPSVKSTSRHSLERPVIGRQAQLLCRIRVYTGGPRSGSNGKLPKPDNVNALDRVADIQNRPLAAIDADLGERRLARFPL